MVSKVIKHRLLFVSELVVDALVLFV